MKALLEQVLQGQIRAIARVITRVENSTAVAEEVIQTLYPHTGKAHIIGITGSPGAGKSTVVNALVQTLRQKDAKIGIVAVDPSSPFTGGALLGDRVRMRDLSGDPGIFIRSMASRGSLGGLAQATASVVKVLDAAGYDYVLVETVGAGQAEVDIANAAHTTVVVEAPGMGDEIQSIKAGILEIADILVVNKADRPGADRTVRSLQMMLHLGPVGGTRKSGRLSSTNGTEANDIGWNIPVLETVATKERGMAELADMLGQHMIHLRNSGEWLQRERERSWREIETLLQQRFMRQFQSSVTSERRESLLTAVAAREVDPYTAVNQLLSKSETDV
ncbi:methylmalonyl Co-A mutase-associated GTPase MeaB [Candidatus Leptofilum sp.]|uniref:methylmalonyl Co-A mutase-associated GTPase MeaB n=1 Tax=Candidatus Leptofilum sp. TaxID=3241576 RepID=UPI003B5CD374